MIERVHISIEENDGNLQLINPVAKFGLDIPKNATITIEYDRDNFEDCGKRFIESFNPQLKKEEVGNE